jgi:hypothetical protein
MYGLMHVPLDAKHIGVDPISDGLKKYGMVIFKEYKPLQYSYPTDTIVHHQKTITTILDKIRLQFILQTIGKKAEQLSSGLQIKNSIEIFNGIEVGTGVGIFHFPCFLQLGYSFGKKNIKPLFGAAYGYNFISSDGKNHPQNGPYTYKNRGGGYGHLDAGILFSPGKNFGFLLTFGYTVSHFSSLIQYTSEYQHKKVYITSNYTINFGIQL